MKNINAEHHTSSQYLLSSNIFCHANLSHFPNKESYIPQLKKGHINKNHHNTLIQQQKNKHYPFQLLPGTSIAVYQYRLIGKSVRLIFILIIINRFIASYHRYLEVFWGNNYGYN